MRSRPSLLVALALLAALATGCATTGGAPTAQPTRTAWSSPTAPPAEELILVTFALEQPLPASRAGSVPRSYGGRGGYTETGWEARMAHRLARRYDLEAIDEWPIEPLDVHCVVYRVASGQEVEAVVAAIATESGIDSVQPMGRYRLETEPADSAPPTPRRDPRLESPPRDDARADYDDPYLSLQHGLETLGLPWAHRWATGAGVRVGVVDTAVDGAHSDLQGRVEELDFVGGARDPGAGDADHGTAVAGVIAAAENNGRGIIGVAPGVTIQALRACWRADRGPSCNTFTLARALSAVLTEARSRRPAILNLSLSGAPDPLLERLLSRIVDEGIAVVAAVGARADSSFPASLPAVIAVDRDDRPPRGEGVPGALLAPGADILTTLPRDSWGFVSGTSLAAAHVSGAAALVLELAPGTPPSELRRLLLASGATPGTGAVDACLTLSAVRSIVACPAHGPAGVPSAGAAVSSR